MQKSFIFYQNSGYWVMPLIPMAARAAMLIVQPFLYL